MTVHEGYPQYIAPMTPVSPDERVSYETALPEDVVEFVAKIEQEYDRDTADWFLSVLATVDDEKRVTYVEAIKAKMFKEEQ